MSKVKEEIDTNASILQRKYRTTGTFHYVSVEPRRKVVKVKSRAKVVSALHLYLYTATLISIMRASGSTSAAAIRRLPLQQTLASLSSGEGSTSLPSRVKALHFSFVQKNAPTGPR